MAPKLLWNGLLPPIFRSAPPLCLTRKLICKFFQLPSPCIQYFEKNLHFFDVFVIFWYFIIATIYSQNLIARGRGLTPLDTIHIQKSWKIWQYYLHGIFTLQYASNFTNQVPSLITALNSSHRFFEYLH